MSAADYADHPASTLDALRRAYAQLVRLAPIVGTDAGEDAANRARLAAIEAECARREGGA